MCLVCVTVESHPVTVPRFLVLSLVDSFAADLFLPAVVRVLALAPQSNHPISPEFHFEKSGCSFGFLCCCQKLRHDFGVLFPELGFHQLVKVFFGDCHVQAIGAHLD